LSPILISRISIKCARSDHHLIGNCSFEWLIRDLNASKARFWKCEYGSMYNLNNSTFASLIATIYSTMKTSRHCTNLIKVCTTSSMGKRQGNPKINSRSLNKTKLYWVVLLFTDSRCILTMKDLYYDITHFRRLNMLIHCVFTLLSRFWPLVSSVFTSFTN
jgi:hypothetical protein